MTVTPFSGPAGAGDPTREIEIEQEVLAERLDRPEAMPRDDVAQRRQSIHGVHAICLAELCSAFVIRLVPREFVGEAERRRKA